MAVPLWTHCRRIPYELMWEDDQHWLPRMLDGEKFRGRFYFEGERIEWMEIDWDVEVWVGQTPPHTIQSFKPPSARCVDFSLVSLKFTNGNDM